MDIALVFDEFRYCEELIDILTMSLKTFRHYIHLSKRICQVILDVLNALTTYVASMYGYLFNSSSFNITTSVAESRLYRE